MIRVEAIPPELRTTDRALVWKRETRDGKVTKVPYRPGRPAEHAAVNDPETWGDFHTALGNVEDGKADGVGFVLGDGIVGIDLDHCRDPESGEIEGWAERMIRDLDSYTEISPSGTGVHIIARGSLPPGRRRRGPVEMYADGRYFTVTGDHLHGSPREIRERTAELAALHARVFGENGDRGEDRGGGGPRGVPRATVALSDRDLVERAMEAENGSKFTRLWSGDTTGYDSHSEADLALVNILAFWCQGDTERIARLFRSSGLMREKWEREDYRARTIAAAMDGRTDFWEPGPPVRGPGQDSRGEAEPRATPSREEGARDLTHDGLALDLGDKWAKDARHVAAWGRWLFWDGAIWRTDETLLHMTRTRQFLRSLAEKLDEDDEGPAKRLRSSETVARVVKLARSNEAQAATVEQWDTDPYALGHPNPEET